MIGVIAASSELDVVTEAPGGMRHGNASDLARGCRRKSIDSVAREAGVRKLLPSGTGGGGRHRSRLALALRLTSR